MPIQRCQKDGKPGFKFGANGTCYTYTAGDSAGARRARELARRQGQTIKVSQGGRKSK